MKTVDVTYNCYNCENGFSVTHSVDTNEHGYFVFPQATCPHCFALMCGENLDVSSIRETG